jgi:hypothetical protein
MITVLVVVLSDHTTIFKNQIESFLASVELLQHQNNHTEPGVTLALRELEISYGILAASCSAGDTQSVMCTACNVSILAPYLANVQSSFEDHQYGRVPSFSSLVCLLRLLFSRPLTFTLYSQGLKDAEAYSADKQDAYKKHENKVRTHIHIRIHIHTRMHIQTYTHVRTNTHI